MEQKHSAERAVREIRGKTRRRFMRGEKIPIVIEGLRGEEITASLCRREGSAENLDYRWSKEFLEAGKKRLLATRGAKRTRAKSERLRRRTKRPVAAPSAALDTLNGSPRRQ